MVTSKAWSSAGDGLTMLFEVGAIGRLTDADLLTQYISGKGDSASEAAFTMIVERHGRMVLGVCRRILGDEHAARDAFQATFLILVRKALTVRVEDSLGGWLYGVSIRVARRAKSIGRAERARMQSLDGFDPRDESRVLDPCDLVDLRAAIDEEVIRLPHRFRSAVVLCDIEGLSHEQAARRLRCPLGTVRSRLHRGRERLRSRLTRRGLAPAVGGMDALIATTARAEVPPGLIAATIGLAAGRGGLGTVPTAVAALVKPSIRSLFLKTSFCTLSFLAVVGLSATGAGLLARGDQAGVKDAAPGSTSTRTAGAAGKAERPIAEQFERIKAEYEAILTRATEASQAGGTDFERSRILFKMSPDQDDFARRMVELAATSPADPAARDALIWVIDKPFMQDVGRHGEHFARAVEMLLSHHADDPEVARAALELDNMSSRRRDALLEGILSAAKNRETKGLARLALARYLEQKVKMVISSRLLKARGAPRKVVYQTYDEKGVLVQKESKPSQDELSYDVQLQMYDPEAMKKQTDELYEEVIREYADIPFITVRDRALKALMSRPEPKWNGKPLTAEERALAFEMLARKRTLAEVARERLDDIHNLAPGKPAPEIAGVDFDGKPLKLSDYRGKVVALVFWGSWCGPCMREIPQERELAERLKGKPFTFLGVNCDKDKQAGARAIADERITWPNWHDGEPGEGPIVKRYHITGYPSVVVLDAKGIIRHKQLISPFLDQAVAELIKELEAK